MKNRLLTLLVLVFCSVAASADTARMGTTPVKGVNTVWYRIDDRASVLLWLDKEKTGPLVTVGVSYEF